MSLINDALKRTQEAQQQQAPAARGPELKPVDPALAKTASNSKTLLYIMVACVIVGNLLIFLYYFSNERSNNRNRAGINAVPTNLAASIAAPIPPAPVIPPAAEAAPQATIAAQPAPVPEPATNVPRTAGTGVEAIETNAAPAAPEPAKPAPLKLQSIMFKSDRPAAMVSGKYVSIGSKVQGFLVTAIEEETVTLVGNGQTNVLSLP